MSFLFKFNLKIKSGFTTAEILIASAIISISMFALLSVGQKSIELSRVSLQKAQASFLLEEGAEAVKIIRSVSWDNIEELDEDTQYFLVYSGNDWSLSETPTLTDSFTRSIVFEDVYRDENDDIAISGTLDPFTKKVTITVLFNDVSRVFEEELIFYISDIFSN